MTDAGATIFLLSPANVNGRRAEHFLRKGATGALALRYQAGELPVDEAFAYISALYFRGKVAYAGRFGAGRGELPGALVIVPGFGLVPCGWLLDAGKMRKIRRTSVDASRPSYRKPLEGAVRLLATQLKPEDRVVLLGSVATGKYLDILVPQLGHQLMFPGAFAGTGDMKRGSLMLRAAASGAELTYAQVADGSSERIRIRGDERRAGEQASAVDPHPSAPAPHSTSCSVPME